MRPLKAVFLFICLTFAARAQTNFEVLVTGQGTYTNAHFSTHSPAWVIVLHDHGAAKVWLTNLPPALQKQFGYSPEKMAEQLALEAKKKAQQQAADEARRKLLASLAGSVQSVRVISIVDDFGQCVITTSNGQQRVYMVGLPASSKNYLFQIAKLQSDLADSADTAKRLQRSAARADANAPVAASGDANYVAAAMNQRTAANNLALDAQNAAENVETMKERLQNLQAGLTEATTFYAYSTGLTDNGLPRWQAVQ